jgi:histone chaperone ASF1
MSLFIVEGLIIQNNPAPVNSPFIIDVRFKCLQKLDGIFDWKVIYVGSADDPSYDQVIETFDMSNLEADVMQIQIQAPPPDFSKIRQ